MKNRCLLLFVLACLCVVPCYGDGSQWVEIKSPHFSVVTDAGEKRGREVAMRFEQMRSVFSALMVKANVSIPVPLQIVAFRNTKELRQCAPIWHGKATQLAGLFQGGQDRSFIMLDMSVMDPWSVVFHEYAHQLMNGTLSWPLDPWFEEGFAEYFASIEVDDKQARVGKIPNQTYLLLQHYKLLKVSDLLEVRHYSETYNESGEHRDVFYAESRMLVHYLYDNKLIPKLSTYFDLKLNQNASIEQAVQTSFGMSVAELDKTLQNYIRSGRYKYYAIPTPADIATSGYTATPLTAAAGNAVVADIHLHSLDYHDKAAAEFQEVLKMEPNNAPALRGLGYAYLQTGKFKEAADYFHQAAQLDSKDPRVHYYSALLMNRQSGYVDSSRLREEIKELETAIELDPTFADPYILLGIAQGASGDPARGLETMRKGVSLNPRNENYQFSLAQMYLANRKFDEGIALLHGIESTQQPLLAARVARALKSAQEMKMALATSGARTSSASTAAGSTTPANTTGLTDSRPVLQSRISAAQKKDSEDRTPTREELAAEEGQSPPQPPPKVQPVKHLQGMITGVDCSTPPAAILTVVSGKNTFRIKVADVNHVILFGADKFSCSWNTTKASLNYRETGGDVDGSVVSLEIQ